MPTSLLTPDLKEEFADAFDDDELEGLVQIFEDEDKLKKGYLTGDELYTALLDIALEDVNTDGSDAENLDHQSQQQQQSRKKEPSIEECRHLFNKIKHNPNGEEQGITFPLFLKILETVHEEETYSVLGDLSIASVSGSLSGTQSESESNNYQQQIQWSSDSDHDGLNSGYQYDSDRRSVQGERPKDLQVQQGNDDVPVVGTLKDNIDQNLLNKVPEQTATEVDKVTDTKLINDTALGRETKNVNLNEEENLTTDINIDISNRKTSKVQSEWQSNNQTFEDSMPNNLINLAPATPQPASPAAPQPASPAVSRTQTPDDKNNAVKSPRSPDDEKPQQAITASKDTEQSLQIQQLQAQMAELMKKTQTLENENTVLKLLNEGYEVSNQAINNQATQKLAEKVEQLDNMRDDIMKKNDGRASGATTGGGTFKKLMEKYGPQAKQQQEQIQQGIIPSSFLNEQSNISLFSATNVIQSVENMKEQQTLISQSLEAQGNQQQPQSQTTVVTQTSPSSGQQNLSSHIKSEIENQQKQQESEKRESDDETHGIFSGQTVGNEIYKSIDSTESADDIIAFRPQRLQNVKKGPGEQQQLQLEKRVLSDVQSDIQDKIKSGLKDELETAQLKLEIDREKGNLDDDKKDVTAVAAGETTVTGPDQQSKSKATIPSLSEVNQMYEISSLKSKVQELERKLAKERERSFQFRLEGKDLKERLECAHELKEVLETRFYQAEASLHILQTQIVPDLRNGKDRHWPSNVTRGPGLQESLNSTNDRFNDRNTTMLPSFFKAIKGIGN